MTTRNSIGIFDSGIGGLSIAKRIRDSLLHENIIYVADTQHAPYGSKSDEFVIERSLTIANFLIERGAKAIVVACNTATTSAIHHLRDHLSVPIIGVEPGTKPAALNSKSGVVGVLATSRTLATHSFERLVKRTSGNVKIEVQACPDLVLQVESLKLQDDETREMVHQYVTPLVNKGADHIVLGCTHYNFLEAMIADISGPNVSIVNTVQAVVNQLLRQLDLHGLSNKKGAQGEDEFWTSGDPDAYHRQLSQLWGDISSVFQLNSLND